MKFFLKYIFSRITVARKDVTMSLLRTTSGNRGSLFFCIILKSSLTIDWLLARRDSDLRCVTADPVLLIIKKKQNTERWNCLLRGRKADRWAVRHSCLATVQSFRRANMDGHWRAHRHTDIPALPCFKVYKHIRSDTQKKCQTFNREEAAFQPRLAPPAAPLCRGGMQRRIVIRLPPFRRTRFPFSSLFLIHQVFSQTTPSSSAELGFLPTLALRAAVYDAALMYIQHLL